MRLFTDESGCITSDNRALWDGYDTSDDSPTEIVEVKKTLEVNTSTLTDFGEIFKTN